MAMRALKNRLQPWMELKKGNKGSALDHVHTSYQTKKSKAPIRSKDTDKKQSHRCREKKKTGKFTL